MEVIKKQVKRALTVSGVTDNEFVIIPDLNTFYHFKILLTSKTRDIGFFDDVKPTYDIEGRVTYDEFNENID